MVATLPTATPRASEVATAAWNEAWDKAVTWKVRMTAGVMAWRSVPQP